MGIWTFVVGVMNQQEHGPLRQFIDGLPKERWVLTSRGNNYGKIIGITWWVIHEWLSLIQFLWQFPWEVFHLKIRLPPLGNHVKLNFDGSFNLCAQYVDIGGSMSGLAGTHIVTFTGKFAADHSLGDKLQSLLKGIENMYMASTLWL